MTGVLVTWARPEDLVEQELLRDGELLVRLMGIDSAFMDATGEDSSIYRVRGMDVQGAVVFDTGLFQMPVNRGADLQTRTRLDHNFPSEDSHRYVDVGGNGIDLLAIRVYRAIDWMQNRKELALALVETDEDGRWKAPVFLEPGLDYTLVVEKNGFGPVVETITL